MGKMRHLGVCPNLLVAEKNKWGNAFGSLKTLGNCKCHILVWDSW